MPIIGRAVRGTSISRPGSIFFPKLQDVLNFKIDITDSDGIKTDVVAAGDVVTANFTWRTLRNGLGNFNITLSSPSAKYLNIYQEGDLVEFYGDFSSGTTKIFEGEMEEPRYGFQIGYFVAINGMKNPELAGKKLTKTFTARAGNLALQDVLDEAFPGQFTYTNLSSSMTTLITAQYTDVPVVEILKDILKRSSFDGYIDFNDDVHAFAETGVINANEYAVQGINVLSVAPFGKDTLKTRNKVRVYGQSVENCPLIRTVTASTTSWDREEIFKSGNITKITDVASKATTLLTEFQNPLQETTIGCNALPSLRPGDSIKIRVPYCNLDGNYFIPAYTHKFSAGGGWETSMEVNRVSRMLAEIHLKGFKEIEENRELENSNSMTDTVFLFTFDDETDIDSLSDCQVSNGNLIISAGGGDTATMISSIKTAPKKFTQCEIRGNANTDFLQGPSFIEVSNDGGSSYVKFAGFKTLTTLSSSNGQVILKVTLKTNSGNPNPALESLALEIK